MDIEVLAKSLSRDQRNMTISMMSDNLDELQAAMRKEFVIRDRQPINLLPYGLYAKAHPDDLAHSLSDEQLSGMIIALCFAKEFKTHLLIALMKEVNGIIDTMPRDKAIAAMRPIEILIHMTFSAKAKAEIECPETPKCAEACTDCKNRVFKSYFGH
ncbi:MAG: hypothetical protein ACAF41_12480 [Leptolyngbya sp. BL-A-14]